VENEVIVLLTIRAEALHHSVVFFYNGHIYIGRNLLNIYYRYTF